MNQEYPPLQMLRKICENKETGNLHIHSNQVLWNIYLIKGKIQYAQHNLQSLDTIKNYLVNLKIPLTQGKLTSSVHLQNPFFLLLNVNKLVENQEINTNQRDALLQKLTEDALESFICLPQARNQWEINKTLSLMNAPNIFKDNGIKGTELIDSLKIKLTQWQKLTPIISSPHQRPYCPNLGASGAAAGTRCSRTTPTARCSTS